MKKQLTAILCVVMVIGMALSGCGNSSEGSSTAAGGNNTASSQNSQTSADEGYPSSDATELVVRFGDDGAPFTMHLEDNSTAAAIAGYVGTTIG